MARKLTVEEIEDMIRSELGAPRRPEDLKVKQKPWHQAEPEGPNVKKALSIKEMYRPLFEAPSSQWEDEPWGSQPMPKDKDNPSRFPANPKIMQLLRQRDAADSDQQHAQLQGDMDKSQHHADELDSIDQQLLALGYDVSKNL